MDTLKISIPESDNATRLQSIAASIGNRLLNLAGEVHIVPDSAGLVISARCQNPRDIFLKIRLDVARAGFLASRDILVEIAGNPTVISQDECTDIFLSTFDHTRCPVCGGALNHYSGVRDEAGAVYPVDYCQDCDFTQED